VKGGAGTPEGFRIGIGAADGVGGRGMPEAVAWGAMGGGIEEAAGVLIVFLPRRALRSILGLLSDMAWFRAFRVPANDRPWLAGPGQ
jgi:hypothetical protein